MKISRIFKWLKGLSREDWAKNLCLKVLEKMPDEYLVYIEELKSGIIGPSEAADAIGVNSELGPLPHAKFLKLKI